LSNSLRLLATFLAAAGLQGCVTAATLSPDRPTVFITGSNRGLGLEFARQYAARDWNVIATCRNPGQADELRALARGRTNVAIERLDVTDDRQIRAIAKKYRGQPIDVLLNNAGIWGSLDKQTFGKLDFAEQQRVYEVNALGPLRVTQALIENVAASREKKIIGLGGGMALRGTVLFAGGGHYWYRMSRAANLISMVILHTEVKDRGIIITFIVPGFVDTQMLKDSGWPDTAPRISPAESARLVIDRIAALDASAAGKLINYDGTLIHW
jgi:NAD(P)-dependent dehydrogenase (short-subunit alcohol dehydrogenase family)